MNFVRTSPDEVLITDGKTVVLVMSRDNGEKHGEVQIESQSLSDFTDAACEGCNPMGLENIKRTGQLCEDCTVGQEIPR